MNNDYPTNATYHLCLSLPMQPQPPTPFPTNRVGSERAHTTSLSRVRPLSGIRSNDEDEQQVTNKWSYVTCAKWHSTDPRRRAREAPLLFDRESIHSQSSIQESCTRIRPRFATDVFASVRFEAIEKQLRRRVISFFDYSDSYLTRFLGNSGVLG